MTRAAPKVRNRCKTAIFAFALVPFSLAWTSDGMAHGEEAFALKSAYIRKFLDFVEWPDATNKDASEPMKMCVIDQDDFAASLGDMQAASRGSDISVEVSFPKSKDNLSDCQIIYIGRHCEGCLDVALAHAAGRPTLTISDSPGFAERGVIINFFQSENKLRFEINPQAAQDSGLYISSQLLKLARVVSTNAVVE